MTRTLTLTLPHGVASFLELRAAIDDLTLEKGLEQLLTVMAERLSAKVEADKKAYLAGVSRDNKALWARKKEIQDV